MPNFTLFTNENKRKEILCKVFREEKIIFTLKKIMVHETSNFIYQFTIDLRPDEIKNFVQLLIKLPK